MGPPDRGAARPLVRARCGCLETWECPLLHPAVATILRWCHRAILPGLVLQIAACAPAAVQSIPSPAEIPLLEARYRAEPGDLQQRFRLAEAYRRDGKLDAAGELLTPVTAAEPEASFLLGLVREDQERFAEARERYADYVDRGRNPDLRRRARDHIALLGRLELQQAVRSALQRESALAGTAPAPRTVGVFPFLLVSPEAELAPLGTALAELLSTDLGQTDRLTVIERSQVRLLLDELDLAQSGRVDPATAARSGRLLGASTIVQGRIEGNTGDLAVEAAVIRVPTDTLAGDPLRERDPLAQLFDMEKRIAVGVYERSGIQLTSAELQRVLRRPTSNIQALLAFGQGLEAQDAGRYDEARAFFVRSTQLDPGFDLASNRLEQVDAQLRAMQLSPQILAEIGLAGIQNALRQDRLQTAELLVPDPIIREAFPEASGLEGAGRSGTAEIIIRRPGGDE